MSDIPSAVIPSGAADASVANLKLPPHSLEAEQSVLGGLMLEDTAWDRAAEIVTENDFYRRDHRLIFSCHRHCWRRRASRVMP
jgi:replicative DNA helicase